MLQSRNERAAPKLPGTRPAAPTLLIEPPPRTGFAACWDRCYPSPSRFTCGRTFAHCPSQSFQRGSEPPNNDARQSGSLCHRPQSVLLCGGCRATRRCFTVAAGNNVRVAFLAAGAPRADQQMRSGTWYEIGTLFMRGSADGNLPLSRARHARRTPVTGPTIPEFARNPKPNQPSQDFMAYRSRN
jgi:hypothetical protein